MSVVETNGRRAPAPEMPEWVIQANLGKLDPHEIANQWNMQKQEEFEGLCDSLRKIGLQRPITLYEGKILDGRNRYNACRKLGLGTEEKRLWYPFVHFEDRPYPEGVTWPQAATALVITKNIMRRNLTPDQRAMIAAELYAKLPRRQHGGDRKSNSLASELEKLPTADSQKVAVASQLGVSVKHVERAATLQKKDVSKAQQVQAGPRRWRRPSKN